MTSQCHIHQDSNSSSELELIRSLWTIFGFSSVIAPLIPKGNGKIEKEPADIACFIDPFNLFLFYDKDSNDRFPEQIYNNMGQFTRFIRHAAIEKTSIDGSNIISKIDNTIRDRSHICMFSCNSNQPTPALYDEKSSTDQTHALRKKYPDSQIHCWHLQTGFVHECAKYYFSIADFMWLISYNSKAVENYSPPISPAQYKEEVFSAAGVNPANSKEVMSWFYGLSEQMRISAPRHNIEQFEQDIQNPKKAHFPSDSSPIASTNLLRLVDRLFIATTCASLARIMPNDRSAYSLHHSPLSVFSINFNSMHPSQRDKYDCIIKPTFPFLNMGKQVLHIHTSHETGGAIINTPPKVPIRFQQITAPLELLRSWHTLPPRQIMIPFPNPDSVQAINTGKILNA